MRRIIVLALFAIVGVFALAGVAQAGVVPCAGASESPPCSSAFDPAVDPAATGVAGSSAVAGARSLPYTGSSDTSTLVWVGGGLVLAGGVVVVFSYRRRAAALHS